MIDKRRNNMAEMLMIARTLRMVLRYSSRALVMQV